MLSACHILIHIHTQSFSFIYTHTQYKFLIDIPPNTNISIKFSCIAHSMLSPALLFRLRSISNAAVTIVFAERLAIVRATITRAFQVDSRNCNVDAAPCRMRHGLIRSVSNVICRVSADLNVAQMKLANFNPDKCQR